MKLNAKQRLLTANWADELDQIENKTIKGLVTKLSKIINIHELGTDGYNDDGQAGCEVIFAGKTPGTAWENPVMKPKVVAALSNMMNSTPKVVFELCATDDGFMCLFIIGKADS